MKTTTKLISLIILLSTAGCQDLFFEPEPQNNPEAIFEELWGEFDRHYAPFEERGVDWDEQYSIFRPQLTQSTANDELEAIFKQMMGTLNDSHVDLIVPGKDSWIANRYVNEKVDHELFNIDLIKDKYLENNYLINGYELNTYGWIGDVGYVHMKWISDNMFDFPAILDYFENAKGLIIDIRHNGGGQHMWGLENSGRLTNEKRLTHRVKTKNGTGKDDYTDWYDWYLEPEGEYYNKPIVFLTDRYTISAGERMTYAYKVLPNATHMGDTTNGSIGTKVPRELANGWKYSIVTQKVMSAGGTLYEGVGIPPEIYVKNTMTEMNQGIDRTFDQA